MKRLYDICVAPLRTELMMAAIELNVFDVLSEWKTVSTVLDVLHTDPANTELFLDALCMIDLLEKENGRYRNTPDVDQFLASDSPQYQGRLFQSMKRECIVPMRETVTLVRKGANPDVFGGNMANEQLWAQSTRNHSSWILGGSGQQAVDIISKLPEFGSFRKMLDMGCGSGLFCIHFVEAHPEMNGVVFDQPAVAKVAQEFVDKYNLQRRITSVGGNYITDDIGSSYDFIWVCATLNFAVEKLDAVLKKCLDALNPGGVLACFQDGMTHEMTKPDMMLGHVIHSLTMGSGMYFQQGQIAEAMIRSGFRSVRSRTVKTPLGDMELDIARKAHV